MPHQVAPGPNDCMPSYAMDGELSGKRLHSTSPFCMPRLSPPFQQAAHSLGMSLVHMFPSFAEEVYLVCLLRHSTMIRVGL